VTITAIVLVQVPAPEPTSLPGQAAAAAAAAVLAVHGDAAGGAAEAEAAGGTSSVGRMGGLLHPDQPGLPVTAAVSKPPNSEEVGCWLRQHMKLSTTWYHVCIHTGSGEGTAVVQAHSMQV
jgi:hypothetical protein